MGITNCVNAQIVNIPDANFKAYLVGNSEINTNRDNEIQLSEAINFNGTIDCNGLNIFNLTGIESFPNIKKLLCYNNQLTHLDVSQNKTLENLQCDENQLTSLDLSNNTALKTLMCHINKLTALDLSKNLDLKDLRCYENQLTEIDLSKNLALEILDCSLNPIRDLDISKNVALKALYCLWNELISLNLKNGNNATLQTMLARGNPNLSCIQVDNVENSNTYHNWTKDATANYNTDCNYMSVKNVDKKEILLYPNPAKDILNFSEEVSDIRIMDFSGRVMKQFSNSSKSINVENLSKGFYFITAKNKLGKEIIQKFIKN